MRRVEQAASVIFVVALAMLVLWMTPLGGIVNALLSTTALIGAVVLAGSAIIDLFSFRDYSYAPHWTGIGLKLSGVVALIVLVVAMQFILPKPTSIGKRIDDSCIETRSNPC